MIVRISVDFNYNLVQCFSVILSIMIIYKSDITTIFFENDFFTFDIEHFIFGLIICNFSIYLRKRTSKSLNTLLTHTYRVSRENAFCCV